MNYELFWKCIEEMERDWQMGFGEPNSLSSMFCLDVCKHYLDRAGITGNNNLQENKNDIPI